MAKAYQCDGCGRLITSTGNRVHIDRIETHVDGATISYPNDTSFDFCDYSCIEEWAEKQHNKERCTVRSIEDSENSVQ